MSLFSFGSAAQQDDDLREQAEARIWYTSLEEFKPLNQRFFAGEFKESFYAKSLKTGEYHVIKKYCRGEAGPIDWLDSTACVFVFVLTIATCLCHTPSQDEGLGDRCGAEHGGVHTVS